uniref:CCHC-type domain-containing protein n=1 Tax=Ananas comosus var. bracteatus TaxID=296719 RepID=A0A6V7P9F9_ANACO|nr:unnamed protein product [Ananas comosus var. bracteatus]
MPTSRSKLVGADDAATFEEAEIPAASGSKEVRELRSQLVALTDLVTQQAAAARQLVDTARQQEVRMQRLEDLLLQQVAAGEAQVSVLPAPVEIVARGVVPCTRHFADDTYERSGSGSWIASTSSERRDPRIIDGEKTDHWIVEKWLIHMEKLFRDTFVEERDRVWLATHHLDGEAYSWWVGIQDNPDTDLAAISWKRFKELLLEHYFLVRVKRKVEQDLREMRQEDRTVAEYEREFSQLLRYAPFVVRDDEDKARIFERGLRSSILRLVQPFHLQTYQDVVNRALIVESCAADLQERRKDSNKGNGKRPVTEGASQTHSGRPPRHSRNWSQSRGRGSSALHRGSERHQTLSCVICGGRHYPQQCSQRQGRCYSCGQEGHFLSDCSRAHVLEAIPVELREDLSFEEQPVKILAREMKKLRNRDIPYVKVEQRRKKALSRTAEDGSSALENTLYDVVSRYSFMDLWPYSSKDLDHLARQEWLAKNMNKIDKPTLQNGSSALGIADSEANFFLCFWLPFGFKIA